MIVYEQGMLVSSKNKTEKRLTGIYEVVSVVCGGLTDARRLRFLEFTGGTPVVRSSLESHFCEELCERRTILL